jgi:histidinol-phosphate/aromatic aminotransferase/cobyric acid decarboxylase-like protein
MVSHYPSQAPAIAAMLAPHLGVAAENLHLANGACEVIHALLASNPGPVLVSVPTFSAYHEFANGPVIMHQLDPADDFRLDLGVLEEKIIRHSPHTVVIINPNNPDGGLIPHTALVEFVERMAGRVDQIIVDESFSHFAGEAPPQSLAPCVPLLPHLVVVNSLSKSYGIAGLRLGYAVMSVARARQLRGSCLWNVNAFAEWFCTLLGDSGFQHGYERARRRYVRDTHGLFADLDTLPEVKTFPSAANFALLQLDRPAPQITGALLAQHGVYVRDCGDKRGLDSQRFIRVAARSRPENRRIVDGLRAVLSRPATHQLVATPTW